MTEQEQWRAQVYALLATLLSAPPEQPLLDNIKQLQVTEPDSSLGQAWQQLKQAAAEADVAAVSQEYHALFIGLTQGELLPYGSYYQTGFLHEEPLAELRQDLGLLGLERQQDKREPEDHIAAEMDVMRLILTAQGTPVVDAKTFFNRHISPWAQRFFNELEKSGSANFYRGVAGLGHAFINSEMQQFK
jgi:TorA maturation chaperone TorD